MAFFGRQRLRFPSKRAVVYNTKHKNCDVTLAWFLPFFQKWVLIQRCGKTLTFRGAAVEPHLPQESRIFPQLRITFYSSEQDSWSVDFISCNYSLIRKPLLAEAEYVDSYGNSTCPKTPEEAFFASEEAEAVPMESEVFCRSGSKLSTIVRMRVSVIKGNFHCVAVYINYGDWK